MGMLCWIMMGLAIWHFTVFVPDKFWGGIVGAFLAALAGSVVFGLLVNGLSIPGRADTELITAAEGIPGAIIGLAISYAIGARQEKVHAVPSHSAA
jgi:uncharacterized membrane protein YeaQ/YmgE (transglycosylase-associated protein family)